MRQLQPKMLVWMGPEIAVANADLRWVGNESGQAPANETSVRNHRGTVIWYPSECDVSIRPGWFYHADQDGSVKSVSQLMSIYFASVGHNSTLLLNIPPDPRGLLPSMDVARLGEFKAALDNAFKTNLATGQAATADSVFSAGFAPGNAVDGNLDSYWAAGTGKTSARLELDLGAEKPFNVVSLAEPIALGERSTKYHVEVLQGGTWTTIGGGTAIGSRQLVKVATMQAQKIAVVIEQARGVPALAEFGVFQAP
jgi:alpha-L-fucosidase